MLRLLVAALVIANLAWWAWHTPPVAQALGLDGGEREPQRLERQLHPELIQVLPAASSPAARRAAASPERAAACLELGPVDDDGFAAARRALQQAGVAGEAWVDVRRETPALIVVYMGKFSDAEQLRRKGEELQRLKLPWEALSASAPAALTPGLTLGRFTTDGEAQERLKQLQAKGVRTARVLTLTPAGAQHTLRVDKASAAQQARLMAGAGAGASAPESGGRWRLCAAGAPPDSPSAAGSAP